MQMGISANFTERTDNMSKDNSDTAKRKNKKKEPARCCENTTDCFAYCNGICIALEDTDFKGRHCPFYKKKEERRTERHDSV